MRLERFISHATDLSRSQVLTALRQGRIEIDGKVAKTTAKIDPGSTVCLDGQPLSLPHHVYLMLNKPAGTVCVTVDSRHPTVLDLLNPELLGQVRKDSLQIAGRLDLDTTGLVLVTTDGQWNHRATAPAKASTKTYHVHLHQPLQEDAVALLEKGILLRSESKPTRPCKIERITDRQVRISLFEGRYHQVKRMFAAVGNHVVSLHRTRMGAIHLDPALKPGQYRPLNPIEIDSV